MIDCVSHGSVIQVIAGGNYDVDVVLYDPNEKVLYEGQRKQYFSVDFDASVTGTYYFCFSNEFSSFTHKVGVYPIEILEWFCFLNRN